MATRLYANNAKGYLQSGINAIVTSLTLTTGEGAAFPAPTGGDWFLVTLFEYDETGEINHEICKCTARTGDVLTISRAEDGTTARVWGASTPVELRVTKATL